MPPPADRQTLQNLCDEDEQGDEKCRRELPDDRRRQQSNSHGKFHGHPHLNQIGSGLVEDRIPADQNAGQSKKVHPA